MGEKMREEPPQKWRKMRVGPWVPAKTTFRLVEAPISYVFECDMVKSRPAEADETVVFKGGM